jgi:hypothetical protein
MALIVLVDFSTIFSAWLRVYGGSGRLTFSINWVVILDGQPGRPQLEECDPVSDPVRARRVKGLVRDASGFCWISADPIRFSKSSPT